MYPIKNMRTDHITIRGDPSGNMLCQSGYIFAWTILHSQPFWLIVTLYAVTCVQQNALLPIYDAVGSEKDTASFALFKVLSLFILYVPYMHDASETTNAHCGSRALWVVATILSFNFFVVIREPRPITVSVFLACVLTAFVVISNAIALRFATLLSQCLAWAYTVTMCSVTIAAATTTRDDNTSWLTATSVAFQWGWFTTTWVVALGRRYQRGHEVPSFCNGVTFLAQNIVVVALLLGMSIAASIWLDALYAMFVDYSNFSGIDFCRHGNTHTVPSTPAELSLAIEDAYTHSTRVRAVGGGHSWNSFSCPAFGGLIVDMQELRHMVANDDQTFVVGGGATMGAVVNFLMKHGRALPQFWVADITIGGAIATGVHNHGVGFVECCVERVTLVDGTGQFRVVDNQSAAYPFLAGSIGLIGVVAEVELKSVPLKSVHYEETWMPRTRGDAAVVRQIKESLPHTSMWVTRDNVIFQSRHERTPVPTPSDAYTPFGKQKAYVHNVLGRRFYASMLSSVLVVLPLISYAVASMNYDDIEAYVTNSEKAEMHYTHTPTYIQPNKVSRMMILKSSVTYSTIDTDVIVHERDLADCLSILFDPPLFYAPLLHIRHAQARFDPLVASGNMFHIDFSIPTWTISHFRRWLERLNTSCKTEYTHAGKASLTDLLAYDDNDYKTSHIPPQLRANKKFKALRTWYDPNSVFAADWLS